MAIKRAADHPGAVVEVEDTIPGVAWRGGGTASMNLAQTGEQLLLARPDRPGSRSIAD